MTQAFSITVDGLAAGTAPVNTVAPVASGTPTVGETLSVTDGTWTGTPVITFTYQWRRDAATIGGATNSTYLLVEADEAADIDCLVTGTNGFGNSSADSNDLGPVAPAPDEPWAGYFTDAGITNSTAQTAINAFFDGLATDSIQSKVKVFAILQGEAATAINVMQDAFHGSLVNSPTFTAWVGVRGNATTSYISTGTALNAITGVSQNSTAIGCGVAMDTPGVGVQHDPNLLAAYGDDDPFYGTTQQPRFDGDSEEYSIYPNVNDDYSAAQSTPVNWGTLSNARVYSSRTSSTALASYYGATQVTSQSITSVGLPGFALYIAAINNLGTPGFSDDSVFDAKWYMIAEGLSGAEIALFNSRVATLEAALEALA